MTTYISADQPPAGQSPFANLMIDNPLLAAWTLPLTLTQAWMSAWTSFIPGNTAALQDSAEQLHDSAEGGQIPVPEPIQESKDSQVFA